MLRTAPPARSDLNVLKVQTLVLVALGSVLAFVWLVPRSALLLAACNSPVLLFRSRCLVSAARRCVCRIVMPVVRDIRLLGFIISTIVLGLLTKGYKISVQKIAFMTLKGIKVEVPERGVLVQVEEVSLTILQGAKWFSLLVRRPRVELDLPIARPVAASASANTRWCERRPSSSHPRSGRWPRGGSWGGGLERTGSSGVGEWGDEIGAASLG